MADGRIDAAQNAERVGRIEEARGRKMGTDAFGNGKSGTEQFLGRYS